MTTRQIMNAEDVRRAITRLGHEIVEKHGGSDGLMLVGIARRGVPLAARLAAVIQASRGVSVPVGSLDVAGWRDDLPRTDGPVRGPSSAGTGPGTATSSGATPDSLPLDPSTATTVLVDDVLYTGRTIRAAIQSLTDVARPAAVRVAVLVDRGHRELPIRADHVGRNIPTAPAEVVRVRLREVDGTDDAVLVVKPD